MDPLTLDLRFVRGLTLIDYVSYSSMLISQPSFNANVTVGLCTLDRLLVVTSLLEKSQPEKSS